MLDIVEMIRDKLHPVVHEVMPVEIMENEKTRKPETGPPEGIRHPSVQVIVIWGRTVVRDDGRTFIRVVFIYNNGIGIIVTGGG